MRAGGLCTAGRREPCQAGNRAALSGLAGAMQVVSVRPHILLHVSSIGASCLAFGLLAQRQVDFSQCIRFYTENGGLGSFQM